MILSPEETRPIGHRHTSSYLVYFLLEKNLVPASTFADIGALHSRAGDGFSYPSAMYWIPKSKVHAFEAHPENFRKLQTSLYHYPAEVVPHLAALSNRAASVEFFETINPLYSSLCRPLTAPAENFYRLEGLKLHRTFSVNTHTLDTFCLEQGISTLAALHLDVNGQELPVLQGGQHQLTTCLLVVARLGLYPLYESQSGLGNTQAFLRENGLQYHHARHHYQRRLNETELYHTPQVLSAEALFFPSLERLPKLSPEQLLQLSILASLYEVLDLAEKALGEYDRRQQTTLLTEFREAFLERFNPAARSKINGNPLAIPGTPETIFLPMKDGVEVSVPDTLNLLTPYLLKEQGDWMEIELPWLRQLLKPGMKVLDIGANYGIYSLSLAKVVGAAGKVWAVEPTPQLYASLLQSRAKNNFQQLEVFQQALSLREGEAAFYISGDSEYNSLTPSETGASCIRVTTETLDHFTKSHGISGVDFLKIDAEGEEVNILESGQRFLTENDPLILAEVRHGKHLNLEVVDKLASLGYKSYRLIPGLGILTEYDRRGEADAQQLNVLACKSSRADLLHRAGLLSPSHETYDEIKINGSAYELYLSRLPYGPVFATRIPQDWVERFEGGTIYRDCLHAFSLSLLTTLDANKRVGLLEFAFHQLSNLVEKEATLPRLLSLARIASSWGRSDLTQSILARLSSEILAGTDFRMLEPFLCPSSDFDHLDPQPDPGLWCVATILHEKIKVSSLSSFFDTTPPMAELQKLEALGYLLPNMRKRLELIRTRLNR